MTRPVAHSSSTNISVRMPLLLWMSNQLRRASIPRQLMLNRLRGPPQIQSGEQHAEERERGARHHLPAEVAQATEQQVRMQLMDDVEEVRPAEAQLPQNGSGVLVYEHEAARQADLIGDARFGGCLITGDRVAGESACDLCADLAEGERSSAGGHLDVPQVRMQGVFDLRFERH